MAAAGCHCLRPRIFGTRRSGSLPTFAGNRRGLEVAKSWEAGGMKYSIGTSRSSRRGPGANAVPKVAPATGRPVMPCPGHSCWPYPRHRLHESQRHAEQLLVLAKQTIEAVAPPSDFRPHSALPGVLRRPSLALSGPGSGRANPGLPLAHGFGVFLAGFRCPAWHKR